MQLIAEIGYSVIEKGSPSHRATTLAKTLWYFVVCELPVKIPHLPEVLLKTPEAFSKVRPELAVFLSIITHCGVTCGIYINRIRYNIHCLFSAAAFFSSL